MSPESSGPFRRTALERLSSPERLDRLLQLADRRSWLPLATLAVLVLALVVWSVIGRVPVHVTGRAILVRPREVVALHAPGAGYVADVRVAPGDAVQAGQLIATIERPDLETSLELERARLGELRRAIRRDAGDAADGSTDDLAASRRLAAAMRDRALEAIADERAMLEGHLAQARDLVATMAERVEDQRRLRADGVVAVEAVIDAEDEYADALERLSRLEQDHRSLRTDELEVEERYLDRQREITDRELEISNAVREIARLEGDLREVGRIVAERPGTIVELHVDRGAYVTAGARVGTMAGEGPADEVVALGYFSVRDGKRIDTGMRAGVTPDTVERQRYGSIDGTVERVSLYPVSPEDVRHIVGNEEIARELLDGGRVIQVRVHMALDPTTVSGYRWTSSRGPDRPLTANTTGSVRVAIESRAPVTFVLPFLREAVGID